MLKPVSIYNLKFDGENQKFELLENLFQTRLKIQPQEDTTTEGGSKENQPPPKSLTKRSTSSFTEQKCTEQKNSYIPTSCFPKKKIIN